MAVHGLLASIDHAWSMESPNVIGWRFFFISLDHTQMLMIMCFYHEYCNLSIHNDRVILEINQVKSEKTPLPAQKIWLWATVKKQQY